MFRAVSPLLIGGLFGIGWGLGGLCPGPAVASLAMAPAEVGLFVLMMLAGLALGRMLTGGPARRPAQQG